MAKAKTHGAVEFTVLDARGRDQYFSDQDEAALFAFQQALQSGKWVNLNVLIHSEAGARWWGGDDAVERYRSDPEASIFEQMKVKVQLGGMIP